MLAISQSALGLGMQRILKDESEFVVEDVAPALELPKASIVVSKLLLVLAVIAIQFAVMPLQFLQLRPLPLSQVLMQLAQRPPNQQPRFLEPRRHFGRTQDDADIRLIAELVGSGETGPSSDCDARLQSCEALSSQQLIGVLPFHHARGVSVADSHPEELAVGDPAEELVLHAVAAEPGQICSRGTRFLMGQSVGVGELGVFKVKNPRQPVHLPHKGLLHGLVVIIAHQQLSAPIGKLVGRIVAARQHQPIQQLLHRVLFALDQIRRGATDMDYFGRHGDDGGADVDAPLSGEGDDSLESHYLGETGDFQGDD